MEGQPCYPSLGHTDIGFNSFEYNSMADMKLFLISMSYELKKFQPCKQTKKFRKIVKNLFFPLNVEWDSGWDQYENTNIADEMLSCLEDCNINDSYILRNTLII